MLQFAEDCSSCARHDFTSWCHQREVIFYSNLSITRIKFLGVIYLTHYFIYFLNVAVAY